MTTRNTNRNSTVNFDKDVIDTIYTRIVRLVENRTTPWEGTMSELSVRLTSRSVPENFPKTPSLLRRAVNRVVPSLRKDGIKVEFERSTDHSRTRLVRFAQK